MSKLQEIIKYLALAFAFFLITMIVSCGMFLLKNFSSVLGLTKSSYESKTEKVLLEIKDNNIKDLYVDVATVNTNIKLGKSFKVKTDSDYINIQNNNGKISVIERKHNVFGRKSNKTLAIYIPKDLILDFVKLDLGIGNIDISNINLLKGDFDFGIGNIIIESINVNNELSLDCGIGNTIIKSGVIHNLELDTGMGSVKINTSLFGDNKLDLGVGKTELNLLSSDSDYRFEIDKGLGSVKYNNKTIDNDEKFGLGNNIIEVSGGVGKITINTSNNNA